MRYLRAFTAYLFVVLLCLSFLVSPLTVQTTAGTGPKAASELASTWYLAEGSTEWGFRTIISIENPNQEDITARLTYFTMEGSVEGGSIAVPKESRMSVDTLFTIKSPDFSTKVECLEGKPIAVDRTMLWDPPEIIRLMEIQMLQDSYGGHCSIGATAPSPRWYFPEGSSDWGFDCWLAVLNPNTKPVHCVITYMIEDEEPQTFTKTFPAETRQTLNMADDIGEKDASIMICSDRSIVAERSMYIPERFEGSCSMGATEAANDWYLAEGATAFGFESYILLQNPNSGPVTVDMSFMSPDGPLGNTAFAISGFSRKTVILNDLYPGMELSTYIHSDLPVVAERSMYHWGLGSGPESPDWPFRCCTASIGVNAPHRAFYFPSGRPLTNIDANENWAVILNPNDCEVTIQVDYPGIPDIESRTEVIPANSRISVPLPNKKTVMSNPASSEETYEGIGVILECKTPGKKIVAEQSIYWGGRKTGTCTTGAFSD